MRKNLKGKKKRRKGETRRKPIARHGGICL
jgi:hypothetical protein